MHTLRNPPNITPPSTTDSCNSLSVTVLVPPRAAFNTFPVTRCRQGSHVAITHCFKRVLFQQHPLTGFLSEPVKTPLGPMQKYTWGQGVAGGGEVIGAATPGGEVQ